MDVVQRIEALTSIPGVSGWEAAVREEILAQLEGVCPYTVDALGNVIVEKKGKRTPKNKIMLSAHMDEVGFVITFIEDSGLLRFTSVGGVDTRVVVGKPVEIGDGRVYGVIGTKPVHLQEESEREKTLKFDQLYIDIGAAGKEEAGQLVAPGDRAVFSAPFGRFGQDKIYARALDDRAGCAMILELATRELPYDCTLVFTVQEEVGSAGARTAAHHVQPDIAIIVENTTAADIAGVEDYRKICAQGQGPVVTYMDSLALYDQKLYHLVLETAKKKEIPCQSKTGVVGGNESAAILPVRDGVRVIGVSLPCRYLHSPANVLQISDIHHTVNLLEALVEATAEA